MLIGTQASAGLYAGALNAPHGQAWCALNSPARLAWEKSCGISFYRPWLEVPAHCDSTQPNNESPIVQMVANAWKEGKSSLTTATPYFNPDGTPQQFYEDFPGTPAAFASYVGSHFDKVEAATGAKVAQVYKFGFSIFNEPWQHGVPFYPGKTSEITALFAAADAVASARGVMLVAPSWNADTATPAQMAAFVNAMGPLAPYVGAWDLHQYVQHPKTGIQNVIAWTKSIGGAQVVYSTEFSPNQKPIDPATLAQQFVVALNEANSAGMALLCHYPGIFSAGQLNAGGAPGLVDQNANPLNPYFTAWSAAVASIQSAPVVTPTPTPASVIVPPPVPTQPTVTPTPTITPTPVVTPTQVSVTMSDGTTVQPPLTPAIVSAIAAAMGTSAPVPILPVRGNVALYTAEQADATRQMVEIATVPTPVQNMIAVETNGVTAPVSVFSLQSGALYSVHFDVSTPAYNGWRQVVYVSASGSLTGKVRLTGSAWTADQ